MATLFMGGVFQAINASGVAPFAELETYAAGTLTPLATFTDAGGLSSNPTTVICNAAGQANVWLGTAAYRFRLYTATTVGRVLIYDTDNVQSSLAAILVSLAASAGAALVGWIQAGAGAVLRTVQSKLRDELNAKDYGAVADGNFTPGGAASGTDNLAAINAAITAAVSLGISRVKVSGGVYYLSAGFTLPQGISLEGDGNAHMPLFLQNAVRRGTILLINGAAAGDCISFAENAGYAGLRNLSVFNCNTNAIRSVVSVVGHLHWKTQNVEIASLRPTTGVGMLLDGSVVGAQYGTIYGRADNLKIQIANIGTATEASVATGLKVYGRAIPPGPPNANTFHGGSIQGKLLALEMDGTAAGTGARNVAFFGTTFEGVYNTTQTHTFISGGAKVVGFSLTSCYTVNFIKITRGLGTCFHGCYFELGGVPGTYNDGTNGVLPLAAVVWLDTPAEVKYTEFLSCTWSCYVYDNGLQTVMNPTQTGHRYDTRKATNVLVRQNGAQSVPSSVFTRVVFGSVFEGDDAYLDWDPATNQAIIKTAGVYQISWLVNFTGWATAATYATSRCIAQAMTHQGTYAPQGGVAVPIVTTGLTTVTLAIGDTVYVETLQNQGGAQSTSGAAAETRINISKIA